MDSAAQDAATAWIRDHLPVAAPPGLPEVRLHIADARSGLGRYLDSRPGAGPPYWAHPWAGGLVLARHLLDHPDLLAAEQRVLDLGCGSGVVAIAAALGGGAVVRAVDVDPLAVLATQVNAALNGTAVEACCADLLDGPVPEDDLIVVGDLFYDNALAARVLPFLERCAQSERIVLIGDPGRTPLPVSRLTPIARRTTHDFGTGAREVIGTVFRLRG